MKLIDYFNNFEIIDDKCVKNAKETFGENEVNVFINNIDACIDKNLMQKMKDYLFCNSLTSELKNIEKEADGLIRKKDEETEVLNASQVYFREIRKYPLLSIEEEKKYCQDLELGKKMDILKEYLINGKEMFFLDLGKIFVSLYKNEYAALILDCLKTFHYSKETLCNMYINYYLQLYDNLVNRIGYYPNRFELESYFNEFDKYKIIKFGDSYDKITLLEELKKYFKYSFAKEIMINCNLRLVVSIAKKYADSADEIIELINEGNLGLIEAVSRFDVNLGYRFSTYAVYWIRQHISRYVYNKLSSIKITESFKYQLTSFKNNLHELEQKYKRTLSIDEIATNLKMPISKVIHYLSFSYTTISLDEVAFNDKGGITFGDLLCDENNNVEEVSFQNILRCDIEDFLSNLKPREILILKLRFGLDEIDGRPHTFQEISDILGITRERIRQIEKKALTKLKKLSSKSKYSHLNEY